MESQLIGKYVIVRTYSAGVFAGILRAREGKEIILEQSRRLWYWSGSASLSQLAVNGTSDPKNCKFPAPIQHHELTEAIEIIECSDDGRRSIEMVKIWEC
mgnify:CR=1 FL=1